MAISDRVYWAPLPLHGLPPRKSVLLERKSNIFLETARRDSLKNWYQEHSKHGFSEKSEAEIAQLGERQTEDLQVPGSIPGFGILFGILFGPSLPESSREIRVLSILFPHFHPIPLDNGLYNIWKWLLGLVKLTSQQELKSKRGLNNTKYLRMSYIPNRIQSHRYMDHTLDPHPWKYNLLNLKKEWMKWMFQRRFA